MKPLRDSCQNSADTITAFDGLQNSDTSLSEASIRLTELVELTKGAVSKEPVFIANRLRIREEREPHQDKEMTAFLAMQQDERAEIDADFEQKKAALERVYAV